MKSTKLLFKIFGFDIFSESIENNFTTFFATAVLILSNVSQIYSAYHFRFDFFELLLSLMTWPFTFLVNYLKYERYFYLTFVSSIDFICTVADVLKP